MNLPCFRETIIPFVKSSVMKFTMNEQFRERHPALPATLTLSKIRNLKKRMLDFMITEQYEISTVSIAYVLLEKLILLCLVDKGNRKLKAATCIYLAIKFHVEKVMEKGNLRHLLDSFVKYFGVNGKDVVDEEVSVFMVLGCSIFLDPQIVIPHLTRLLKDLEGKDIETYVLI